MEIKKFNFLSFEEWKGRKKEFRQRIGAYTCAIGPFSVGCNGNTKNEYLAIIASGESPMNIHAKRLFFERLECDSKDEQKLKKWYEDMILKINQKWEDFILETYLDV